MQLLTQEGFVVLILFSYRNNPYLDTDSNIYSENDNSKF
jgi:hypothetical protein